MKMSFIVCFTDFTQFMAVLPYLSKKCIERVLEKITPQSTIYNQFLIYGVFGHNFQRKFTAQKKFFQKMYKNYCETYKSFRCLYSESQILKYKEIIQISIIDKHI